MGVVFMLLPVGLVIGVAVVSGVWFAADSGAAWLRTDAWTVLAVLAVLGLPLLQVLLVFSGFGLNPRHFKGDYFAAERDHAGAALAIVVVAVAGAAVAAALGWLGRRRSAAAAAVAASIIAGDAVFGVVAIPQWVAEVARASALVGTTPM